MTPPASAVTLRNAKAAPKLTSSARRAKLAGLPPAMLERAREILESLEAGNQAAVGLPEQMYLFGPAPTNEPSPLDKELEKVDPDALSPREAQEFLYHLKHLASKPRQGK